MKIWKSVGHFVNFVNPEHAVGPGNKVNAMVADALAPCVARASSVMVLPILENRSLSSAGDDFNDLHDLNVEKWQKL